MGTTTMTPELRAELLAMLREEMAEQERQKKENRTVYQRVSKKCEDDFKSFDFVQIRGTKLYEYSFPMANKVRDAIGTLLRAIYQKESTAKLPAEKETDIASFTGDVLSLMKEYRERSTPEAKEART